MHIKVAMHRRKFWIRKYSILDFRIQNLERVDSISDDLKAVLLTKLVLTEYSPRPIISASLLVQCRKFMLL